MNRIIFGLVVFVALSFAAEILVVDPSRAIENTYLIIFKVDSNVDDQQAHIDTLRKRMTMDPMFDNEIIAEYQIGDFQGFTARLSPRLLATQKAARIVDYIEQDSIVRIAQSCSVQNNAVWGLDRIADEFLNLDGIYNYQTSSASGIDAYIVDTGININHNEFGGRAIWGGNFIDSTNSDCNGHGTHVAGTVGGKTYGVAKKVNLIAVKVLNCAGSGTTTGIVQGLQYVVTRYQSTKTPSVINMSLGGSKSTAMDNAVISAVNAGVTCVVAAGNSNDDACNSSPSGVSSVISVGATGTDAEESEQVDVRAEFSNYGKCVTAFAPGVLVQSAWIGSNSATMTISGTSMAAPHVAGIVAMRLFAMPGSSPASIKSWLVSNTVANMIRLDCNDAKGPTSCNGSPNKIVNIAC